MNTVLPVSSRMRPVAFLLGLGVPVAIVVLAWWQWQRVDAWPDVLASIPRYQRMREPWINDSLAVLATLAPLALSLGVLASLSFGAMLAATHRATVKAMQSQDALLSAFERGRRWLPVFMLLQTLLIFGGLFCLLSFESIQWVIRPSQSKFSMKLGVFLGLVALVLAWYGAKIVRDTLRLWWHRPTLEPIHLMGQSLAPADAPRLWAFVREVAERAQAKLPDTVIVGLNEGFFVTEHPVALASGRSVPVGRVLYLPLPYMAFLDRAQVAAVIAHELGHFAGEDTRYSLRFMPLHRDLLDSILAITNEHDENDDGMRTWLAAPTTLYGKWFLASFNEAVHHWSRVRELAADAFGGRVAGVESCALALLRICALHEIIDEALAHNQQAPAKQREGVLPMVRRLVAERGLADPQQRLEDRQTHPLDTHPALHLRLEALGVAITPELIAQARNPNDAGLLIELGLEAAMSP